MTVSYVPNNFEGVLDNGDGKMRPVVYKSRDVVFRHLRQLFLKDAFEAGEDDKAFPRVIIIHNAKLNLPTTFL
jgi:hypothetical protein